MGVINYQLSITNYELVGYGVIKIKSKDRLKDIYDGVEKLSRNIKSEKWRWSQCFCQKCQIGTKGSRGNRGN